MLSSCKCHHKPPDARGPLDKRDRACILCDILTIVKGMSPSFPTNWYNLWEWDQCSSCGGEGMSQASLLTTPMLQVLTELVPTEGGKKWPQQQMFMKYILGWAAGQTKQQSLPGCVSKDLMEEGIPGAGTGGLQSEAYLCGCLGDQQASKLQ